MITVRPCKFQPAVIVLVVLQLVFGVQIKAGNILEAFAGGASGTSWNQGSQWTGGAIPAAGNHYMLNTNTANNSTLASYYGVSFGTGYIRTPADGNASIFLGDSNILPPGPPLF